MYVSVLEYRVHDVDEATWSHATEELARGFAQVPGLQATIWLHGEGDRRGGVYVWLDKAAFDRFLASGAMAALASHANVADLTIREYAVDETPTTIDHGRAFGAAWAAQYTH